MIEILSDKMYVFNINFSWDWLELIIRVNKKCVMLDSTLGEGKKKVGIPISQIIYVCLN